MTMEIKPDGFVPMMEAAALLGVDKVTFRKLVDRGEFTLFRNPHDRRSRLVSLAELRAYLEPEPVGLIRKAPRRAPATRTT